ncbi:PaaI family thioesterase [Kocuria sp. p3-SID1433]|uniref:PaaI family thioesterase n=1 Tax=Kocuria TaxID=57493 RepID=UPI0021A7D143|nr:MULTISPECIES: PaaI family thioesterase [unclassified Kocuria]MCT1602510.1 PaaI family thioesterase [Kocuria sp. p3-SID1428]MCT2180264.1 PaaI family thioesterase [Kocuria sp. p3-SID1433]
MTTGEPAETTGAAQVAAEAQGPDWSAMTGLETLRWLKDHDSDAVPSIRRLLGMSFDEVEAGRVVMSVKGMRLRAEGTTIHVGGRTATAEGRVHDENGRLIAHATTTCLVIR